MMKKYILFILLITATNLFAQSNLVAHWSFDNIREERKVVEMVRGETYVPKEVFAYVKESISNRELNLEGKFYKEVKGVKGNATLFDGYTTYIEIMDDNDDDEVEDKIERIPVVTDAFTIEAWVALGAYPKNDCPIIDHRRDVADGFFNGYSLEIDALGRAVLKVATRGKNEIATSPVTIPLNQWTHVAATYSKDKSMAVYINGELVASTTALDAFTPAIGWKTSMLIGKSRTKTRPYGTIRPEGTEPSSAFFDGLLDELKLYNEALSSKELSSLYNRTKTNKAPELAERKLPSGPKSPKVFRAVNTTLKYYEGWDAPWAIGENADIVVQFGETDCKFVFWHGASYIPNWVSENDIWFNNAFNEGWNDHGSCEPMSDKKAKYSTVKIIESNDARVVVQWRYGLVDVLGTFAFEDPETGWGDWTNETFTIYPDMVGVREDKLLSNAPNAAHEWQESIMVMGPGQAPEDVLEYGAVSLANEQGENETISWEHEIPAHFPPSPEKPTIQIINTKATYNPFSIVRPQDNPIIDIYSGEIRRDVSVFPWWNHWPVAPRPTDGRHAQFADRASHASLSHWNWGAYKKTDRSMTKIMLNGLTNKSVKELVPLAKSWTNPPTIELSEKSHTSAYAPEERAYKVKLTSEVSQLGITLNGSKDSPVVNPAFVIENWGSGELTLKLNGEIVEKGSDFRYGFRDSLESIDLIVWLRLESEEKVSFEFSKN